VCPMVSVPPTQRLMNSCSHSLLPKVLKPAHASAWTYPTVRLVPSSSKYHHRKWPADGSRIKGEIPAAQNRPRAIETFQKELNLLVGDRTSIRRRGIGKVAIRRKWEGEFHLSGGVAPTRELLSLFKIGNAGIPATRFDDHEPVFRSRKRTVATSSFARNFEQRSPSLLFVWFVPDNPSALPAACRRSYLPHLPSWLSERVRDLRSP